MYIIYKSLSLSSLPLSLSVKIIRVKLKKYLVFSKKITLATFATKY